VVVPYLINGHKATLIITKSLLQGGLFGSDTVVSTSHN
jgi:hypothetical protein